MPAIVIKNESGSVHDYFLFPAPLKVTGGDHGEILSNVMEIAQGVFPTAAAEFEVSTSPKYAAFSGMSGGRHTQGGLISMVDAYQVTLGTKPGITEVLGSTVELIVEGRFMCKLGRPRTPGQGKVGSFELDTTVKPGNDFSASEAQSHNFLVGIAVSQNGDRPTPMSSFTPFPNTKYQITPPQATFYIAAGEGHEPGKSVKAEMFGNAKAVDFNARGTNTIILVHGEDGTFRFE